MDLEPPVSVGSRCPTTNVFTSTISNCAKASPCRSGWRCSIRGSSSYRSGRSTASRAGAGWSFQPPPEPKKLIDHNAHTQKHQYDDDGGLHLLIIPRGWRGRVLFRPPFAPVGGDLRRSTVFRRSSRGPPIRRSQSPFGGYAECLVPQRLIRGQYVLPVFMGPELLFLSLGCQRPWNVGYGFDSSAVGWRIRRARARPLRR
jgi:hypothetical protein